MKVYVVSTRSDVVGIFSSERQAVTYCDTEDPHDVFLAIDKYEIDSLVEPEDRSQ